MRGLKELRIFVETCHQGSLSACARKLDLSPALVSAAIKRLESDLETQLFVRSTRSLRLTLEGERFLAGCREALDLLDETRASMDQSRAELSGVLQLSAPSDLGRNLLIPWLDDFMEQHPRVKARLQFSDTLADLYSHPVDLALRYGEPRDSGLIALPVALQNRPVLCASPAYLKLHGLPETPTDLLQHNCLCHALSDTLHDRWTFHKGEETVTVEVAGDRQCKDGDVTRRWAVGGRGIALKSKLDIAWDLREGRLVELDLGWSFAPFPLYLLSAQRRLLNPTVLALKDHLVDRVAALLASV